MAIDRGTRMLRAGSMGIAIAALVLSSPGCSEERGFRRHFDTAPESKPATLGADFKEAPKGQTIPPSGLGVDMVRGATTPSGNPLVETSFRVTP